MPGVTTEMSGLATFLVGALVCYGHFWIATTLSVASLVLLDLKAALEKLAARIAAREILTFAKFLFLSGVILPVLPNQEFGRFHINPFKTWLVVVAISAISYASYVLQKVTKGQGGMVLAALLGGAYSSTVTTVVLARRARRTDRPHLYSGGILIASGMMYLRLASCWLSSTGTDACCWRLFWCWRSWRLQRAGSGRGARQGRAGRGADQEPKNPLELRTAFLFAALFLAMLVVTQLAVTYLGRAGVNTLAAIMGVTDVDPFIMGLTQAPGAQTQ